jgi:hypothetical protein
MNQSAEIKEIATALAKAQGQMNAASKDSTNPHFKSKYADLASVWQACREPLASNGLSITQTMDMAGEKQILVTTLYHSSGQWIKSLMPLPMCSKPQETGSVLSYFRRYSLASMCGVYQSDDDAEIAQASNKTPYASVINEEQRAELDSLLRSVPDARDWILERLRISSVYDIPVKDWEFISLTIRKKMKKKDEAMNG